MSLERLDRRLFLRGLMLTSAGLVVPKPVQVAVPELSSVTPIDWRAMSEDHIYRYSAMGIYANLVMYMAPP